MTRITPVVCGSDTMARAIPLRVLVWEGVMETLLAHPGSTSNVTGIPSTGCPWASCTRTRTSVAGGMGVPPMESPGPIQRIGDLEGKPIPGTRCGSHELRRTGRPSQRQDETRQDQGKIACHRVFLW